LSQVQVLNIINIPKAEITFFHVKQLYLCHCLLFSYDSGFDIKYQIAVFVKLELILLNTNNQIK